MNVEPMQMDPAIARAHYLEYRRSVREHREERRRRAAAEADAAHLKRTQIEREENDLRAAYREMSLGHRVVVLPGVILGAGFDENGLPKLALARATWEWCRFQASSRDLEFRSDTSGERLRFEGRVPGDVASNTPTTIGRSSRRSRRASGPSTPRGTICSGSRCGSDGRRSIRSCCGRCPTTCSSWSRNGTSRRSSGPCSRGASRE